MKVNVYLLGILFFLASCQNSSKHSFEMKPDGTSHISGNAMTMDYHLILGTPLNDSQVVTITAFLDSTFETIDTVYNKWNPNSELSKLNKSKAAIKIPLSEALNSFFEQTDQVVELTQRKFDPTIEPLQQLWKEKLKIGITPSDQELAAIAPAIGWDKIHIENGVFTKSHDLTQIDLGGIAKGYCVDVIIEGLNSLGHADAYVEWGGEIRTSGKHPSGRYWNIFISRFGNTDPNQAITMLALDHLAIATSGDYLQNWTIQAANKQTGTYSTTFFHVFDPKTLRPLESSHTSIASASVTASSCALADGLATAAMMFPTLAEAETWANQLKEMFPDITFWLITREYSESP